MGDLKIERPFYSEGKKGPPEKGGPFVGVLEAQVSA
jgi:hypothetical protein